MTEAGRNLARDEAHRGDDGSVAQLAPSNQDFLSQAISHIRPHLDRSLPAGTRLRALWAAVVAARDLAASDVVEDEFLNLAQQSGLAGDLGRHADDDLRHVVRWAVQNKNPFK